MALCSWKKPVAAAVLTGGRRWREGSSQGHSRLSIRDGTQAHKDLCPEGLEWLLVLQWPRCSSQSGKFQPLLRQTLHQLNDSSIPQSPPDVGCSLQGGHSYWLGNSVNVGHHFWEGGTQRSDKSCWLLLQTLLHKVGVTSKITTASLLLPGLWRRYFRKSWEVISTSAKWPLAWLGFLEGLGIV